MRIQWEGRVLRLLILGMLVLCPSVHHTRAQSLGHHHHDGATQSDTTPAHQPLDGHAAHAMSTKHMDMGPHMRLTELRAPQPGDDERAEEIVRHLRMVIGPYKDYKKALADGYQIFLPNVPQPLYHFTNYAYGFAAAFRLDPERPTSLLYNKTGDGYTLIGAMYTAPARCTEDDLHARIPLSVAQWHLHINFCQAPQGYEREYFNHKARFGLAGSITTREACDAAGGTFRPVIFGWMVHVYPFEQTPQAIWSVARQMEHHRHGQE